MEETLIYYTSYHIISDSINDTNPRVIEDARARKLASDLKRCSYYETCATYGLNVERVFQDGEYLDPDLELDNMSENPKGVKILLNIRDDKYAYQRKLKN